MIQILAEFPKGVGCGREEHPPNFDGDKHTNWKHKAPLFSSSLFYSVLISCNSIFFGFFRFFGASAIVSTERLVS